jgi:multidrug resistance efflux pump
MTVEKTSKVFWIVLTLSATVVGVLWYLAWFRSPWPIVGYIVSPIVLSVPLVAGIVALVRKRKN